MNVCIYRIYVDIKNYNIIINKSHMIVMFCFIVKRVSSFIVNRVSSVRVRYY